MIIYGWPAGVLDMTKIFAGWNSGLVHIARNIRSGGLLQLVDSTC
jgi:hypothetical protein